MSGGLTWVDGVEEELLELQKYHSRYYYAVLKLLLSLLLSCRQDLAIAVAIGLELDSEFPLTLDFTLDGTHLRVTSRVRCSGALIQYTTNLLFLI